MFFAGQADQLTALKFGYVPFQAYHWERGRQQVVHVPQPKGRPNPHCSLSYPSRAPPCPLSPTPPSRFCEPHHRLVRKAACLYPPSPKWPYNSGHERNDPHPLADACAARRRHGACAAACRAWQGEGVPPEKSEQLCCRSETGTQRRPQPAPRAHPGRGATRQLSCELLPRICGVPAQAGGPPEARQRRPCRGSGGNGGKIGTQAPLSRQLCRQWRRFPDQGGEPHSAAESGNNPAVRNRRSRYNPVLLQRARVWCAPAASAVWAVLRCGRLRRGTPAS